MLKSLIVSLLPVVVPAYASEAVNVAEWSQWRGPNRDGVAHTVASQTSWPDELPLNWRTRVGLGQSSPVVAGDAVFVFSREGEMEVARALQLRTGEEIWRRAYPAPYDVYPGATSYGAGPKSTPIVFEGRLFTLGISGILTAFDTAEGQIVWQKKFDGRFEATAPPFGASMSPLVVAGSLIVHAGGHDGGALLSIDPTTGDERWVLEGAGPSYSSPILMSFSGHEQIVIQVHRHILGVDPTSGRALWNVPFVTPCDQNIVTPLQAGGLVVVSSKDTGTLGIRVTRDAEDWLPRIEWHTNDVSMYMSSPVLFNGAVVGLSHRKRGQLFVLAPETGAVRWQGVPGRGANAAFLQIGKTLLVLEDSGSLLALSQDGAGLATTRRYHVAESPTFAHPVPTAFGLLIKDETGLSLFGLSRIDSRERTLP